MESFREREQTLKRKGSRSVPWRININVLPSSDILYFHHHELKSRVHNLLEVTTSLRMRGKLGPAPSGENKFLFTYTKSVQNFKESPTSKLSPRLLSDPQSPGHKLTL